MRECSQKGTREFLIAFSREKCRTFRNTTPTSRTGSAMNRNIRQKRPVREGDTLLHLACAQVVFQMQSGCAHMCVCAFQSEWWGATARENRAILLSCYFHITFFFIFQSTPIEAETDLEHSELLASQPSESALEPFIRWFRSKCAHIFTFVKWSFHDCRGLWDMFENKCRGLANLPERRPSPFKSL